jgi:hypothetical protein
MISEIVQLLIEMKMCKLNIELSNIEAVGKFRVSGGFGVI